MEPQDTDTSRKNAPAPDDQPVLTRTEARQGSTRFPVRYVLMASLALAVVALVAAFFLA
jgi:hypothetical protein